MLPINVAAAFFLVTISGFLLSAKARRSGRCGGTSSQITGRLGMFYFAAIALAFGGDIAGSWFVPLGALRIVIGCGLLGSVVFVAAMFADKRRSCLNCMLVHVVNGLLGWLAFGPVTR